MPSQSTSSTIYDAIHVIRGERVMLDADLAQLYGVKTERLNQQVRRNPERFPPPFMFRLTATEWQAMCLQNAGTSRTRRRRDNRPLAFTEHGCLMLSNVLKSARAVEVSVLIIQAFVRLRAAVATNDELARRIDELAREFDRRIGLQAGKLRQHEAAILELLAEIRRLTRFPEPVHREIGFTAKWDREPPAPKKTPGR